MSSSSSSGPAPWLPAREFFALDVRSLALFRICVAVLLILDWADRLPDLAIMYTDAGMLPRSFLRGGQPVSLMLLSGSLSWQIVVACLAFVAALMLLVGWLTPLATFLSYFLLISAHGRNPPIMHGGDQLMRVLLFWCIFLPLGACWSVDARKRQNRPASPLVLSFASFAFIAQLAMVYLFAAAWKWEDEWRHNNDAVYLALNLDAFSTRFAQWLRENHELCRLLTQGSVYLETFGPILLLLPFHVGFQRLVTIWLFVMFHCGLALTLELNLFPFQACAGWLTLLPSSFWDRLQCKLPRLALEPPKEPPAVTAWMPPGGMVANAFVILCFAYVVLWNVRNLGTDYLNRTGAPLPNEQKSEFNRVVEDLMPPQLFQFGAVIGLEQGWGVFAPRPARWAGWFLIVATLADGSKVELLHGADASDRTRPVQQQTNYWNGRWRKLVLNIPETVAYPYLLPGYSEWTAREWAKTHPHNKRIVALDYLWMRIDNRGPDKPPAPPVEVRVGGWKEFAK